MKTITSYPFQPHLLANCAGVCLLVSVLIPAFAQTAPVPTVPVKSVAASARFELDGVVQAVKQSTVAAQITGRIVSVSVKAGDKVRAGQLLATLDDREAQVGMQQSRAQVNQADAGLRNARAQMERTRDLQSKGFISKAAFDTAESQYQAAVAQRDQALATVRASGITQGYSRVTAPFDGWILQTSAQPGDLAVPGTPLMVVYAPQPLRAVVQVPASRSPLVRQAKDISVIADSHAGEAIAIPPANRLEVPSTDPISQTTEWRFDLPAKDAARMVPGQQVRVSFSGDGQSTVARLRVPASAVVQRGELSAVYVVSGKGFALRAVRLGASRGADGIEILSGLSPKDTVATDPLRAAQSAP